MTSVLVLTMTFGIGASTALFSVVYGVLFRPLPFNEPGRLMQVRAAHTRRGVIPYVSAEDSSRPEREVSGAGISSVRTGRST